MARLKSAATPLLDRLVHGNLILVVVGLGIYANSLTGPFIYDDRSAIVENEAIRQLWPPLWLTRPLNPEIGLDSRPVVSLTLALNYAVGQLDARGYHLVNISVHVACSLVLFALLRTTLANVRLPVGVQRSSNILALVCALLWLTHPIQTQSVNYITQRSESIMGLFYLLVAFCTLRGIGDGRRRWYVAAVVCCALGMASKEVMVTAPAMVLFYDRIFCARSWEEVWRRRWGLYCGLLATWILLAALVFRGAHGTSAGFSSGIAPQEYALNQCIAILDYLRLTLWPHPLIHAYGGVDLCLSIGEVLPYAIIVSLLFSLTAVALRYHPPIGFAGLWFFMILLPTSSFVPISNEVAAERRIYLSLVGPIVLAVGTVYLGLEWIAQQLNPTRSNRLILGREISKWGGGILALGTIAMFSCATVERNRDYRSAISIWRSVLKVVPDDPRAHYNMGNLMRSQGNTEVAIEHYHRALAAKANHVESHNNLAVAYQIQGRTDQAVHHYLQALRLNPRSAEVYYNLGNMLRSRGQLEEAKNLYLRALELEPNYPGALNNIGLVLKSQGHLDSAIDHYRRALETNPSHSDVLHNLAIALRLKQGSKEE